MVGSFYLVSLKFVESDSIIIMYKYLLPYGIVHITDFDLVPILLIYKLVVRVRARVGKNFICVILIFTRSSRED